jgi:hypothetical protein
MLSALSLLPDLDAVRTTETPPIALLLCPLPFAGQGAAPQAPNDNLLQPAVQQAPALDEDDLFDWLNQIQLPGEFN